MTVTERREAELADEIAALLSLDTDLREFRIIAHADDNRVHVIIGSHQYWVTVDSMIKVVDAEKETTE
jgi:hypothetical protein